METLAEPAARSFRAQQCRLHFQSHAIIHADFVAKKPKDVTVVVRDLIESSVQIIDMRSEQYLAYIVRHCQKRVITGRYALLRLMLLKSEFQEVASIRQ
jgi:hypothetical protein